ncbi:MAG: hypothetical protein QOE20_1653 [Mycobacterium sp.]|nr:hypothetical protein [Mycobacterium sp.]
MVEEAGVGQGDPAIIEDQHVVGVDVQPGHGEVRRAGQHGPWAPRVGDDHDLVVRGPAEAAAFECLDAGPGGEHRTEPVLRRGLVGVVVARRVVEDDAGPAGATDVQQRGADVGFVELAGEHVDRQRGIVADFVEQFQDALARGESQPFVLFGVSVAVAVTVSTGDRRRVVEQFVAVGPDSDRGAEVPDEGLRLDVTAGESELHGTGGEGVHLDGDGDAGRGVQLLKHAALGEVTRRDHVGVGAERRCAPLIDQSGHVDPPELVDGGIHARIGGFGAQLRMVR